MTSSITFFTFHFRPISFHQSLHFLQTDVETNHGRQTTNPIELHLRILLALNSLCKQISNVKKMGKTKDFGLYNFPRTYTTFSKDVHVFLREKLENWWKKGAFDYVNTDLKNDSKNHNYVKRSTEPIKQTTGSLKNHPKSLTLENTKRLI